MKRTFSAEFIKANCGCYKGEKIEEILKENGKAKCIFTLVEILKSKIPLTDKFWFVCYHSFNGSHNQAIALLALDIFLATYTKEYGQSTFVVKYIDTAKLFVEHKATYYELYTAWREAYYSAREAGAGAGACVLRRFDMVAYPGVVYNTSYYLLSAIVFHYQSAKKPIEKLFFNFCKKS